MPTLSQPSIPLMHQGSGSQGVHSRVQAQNLPQGRPMCVITESKQLFLAFLVVLGVLTALFPAVSFKYHENHSLSKNIWNRQ